MKKIIFLLFILVLTGCNPDPNDKFDYDIIVSETADNLGDLTSVYDDYNSNLIYPAQRMDIFFSSNRNRGGNDFDIVSGKLDFT